MAITYFQRALKLNPKYLAAWTLMGHEFMEVKNTNAAIQSYRKAVGKIYYIFGIILDLYHYFEVRKKLF